MGKHSRVFMSLKTRLGLRRRLASSERTACHTPRPLVSRKPLKALVIISRDLDKGSTRYRIVQYAGWLRARNFELEFVHRRDVTARRVADCDVVFNQKCLPGTFPSRRLLQAARRVVFDFDDAIFTRPGTPFSWWTQWRVNRRFRLWVRGADVVTAANQVLADAARRLKVEPVVLPMALDPAVWKPAPRRDDGTVRIGWAGAPANLPQIERLEPVLAAVLQQHPSARLAILSGRAPRWSLPCEHHPYQPERETPFVQSLDIGLLPLVEDAFTRGKSPIKSLQYLACGVPVVGNVFGATREILQPSHCLPVATDADWIPALASLIRSSDQRAALSNAGRHFVLAHHDMNRVGETLLAALAGPGG